MNQKSNSSPSRVNSNKTAEDVGGLLKLELEESDIPELGVDIDVTKLDITEGAATVQKEKHAEVNEQVKTNPEISTEDMNSSRSKGSAKIKSNLNYVWVSNLHRGVKAADLKQFFSQTGKVNSVKVLSNGKNFYGYLSMQTKELAAKCISDLNESLFQGEKIIVSQKRPDLKNTKVDLVKNRSTSKSVNKEKNENGDELIKNIDDKENVSTKESVKDSSVLTENKRNVIKKDKSTELRNKSNENSKQQMQTKIDSLSYANRKLRQRIDELQRQHQGMCRKYQTLKEDFNKVKFENRQELRKLNQEKESFEKTKKIEQSKIDADKDFLKRELVEVKKLEDGLKRKLSEVKFDSKKSFKRERRDNSPKRRIVPASKNENYYRDDQRGGKSYRSRDKTPSPPRINSEFGKKRNEGNSLSTARGSFYPPKPPGTTTVDYRQNRSYPGYDVVRTNWMEEPKVINRSNSGRFSSNQIVHHPPSAVVVPSRPRSPPRGSYYYPQW